MNKRIGVLGSGAVGQTLAKGLRDLGFDVTIGSRDGHAVENWDGAVGTFLNVAADADITVLAVKGSVAGEVVKSIKDELAGKLVIDTTNPIADSPPVDGVLSFFTPNDDSLMERLQALAPEACFVKTFNSVGSGHMVQPSYKDGTPSMFICGNDESAKKEVTGLLDMLGWETVDMGTARSARAVEPLCILWCIPGLLHGQWSHAFKLLRD